MRGNRSRHKREPSGEASGVTLIHCKHATGAKNVPSKERIPFPHTPAPLEGVQTSWPDFFRTTNCFIDTSLCSVYILSHTLSVPPLPESPPSLQCILWWHSFPLLVYVFHSCSRCCRWLRVSVLRNRLQYSHVGSLHQWHRSLQSQSATVSTLKVGCCVPKSFMMKMKISFNTELLSTYLKALNQLSNLICCICICVNPFDQMANLHRYHIWTASKKSSNYSVRSFVTLVLCS